MEYHLPLSATWQSIPYVFAEMSPISLPVTLLLAVTIFFSRMSGNNEIIALKSLGIPPKALLMPVFAIAFLFSIIGVGIAELAITYGRQGISLLIYSNAEKILFERLRHDHQFVTDNKQITILVKGVDEQQRRLDEPTIILKKEGVRIEARSATIEMNYKAELLTVTFEDFRATAGAGRIIGGERTLEIPLSEIAPKGERNSPSDMGLYRISEERTKDAEQLEQQQRIIATHRTFAACMGSVNAWANPQTEYPWTTPEIADAEKKIRSLQTHQRRLSVEPPRRWAAGFCCFFFVWMGAPLAIWMRKSDFFASFFACFVPILILFYPLFIFGIDQAKSGSLPPMCVWTGNVVIGLIGLWFLRQIHRY
jgi:lipopolysaccharide export system permease protein